MTREDNEERASVNEVRLVGRLGVDPEVKELPSGDPVLVTRLVVAREQDRPTRQTVDTLDCAVWSGRLRQRMRRWRVGDVVEVQGSIRRRFFHAGGVTQSRVEIEVREAQRLQRSAVPQ